MRSGEDPIYGNEGADLGRGADKGGIMRSATTLASCLFLLGVGASAFADEPMLPEATPAPPKGAPAGEPLVPEVTGASTQELIAGQVTAAAKVAQPLREAPSVVSVVTREQVQAYGWLRLDEILFRQPGFSPSQDYERRTVSSRGRFEGWNNNHLLLLVDGVPVNDNIYGGAYTWELTPMFLLKKVEIIRGPGSALYGSSATNGLLNITTRSASDLTAPVEASVRIGNAATQVYDVVAGHDFKLASFLLGYNRYQTDGNIYDSYDNSGRVDAAGSLRKFAVRDQRSSDYVFLKVDGGEALKGLSLQFHFQRWSFETGHGWLWSIPDKPEDLSENREIISLAYRPAVESKFLQEYVLQYQRHKVNWNVRYYEEPRTAEGWAIETLETAAHQIFARVQLGYRIFEDITLIGGVENTLFLYRGDSVHKGNINFGGEPSAMDPMVTDYPPTEVPPTGPNRQPVNKGPYFEWVKGKPVNNVGTFAQLTTGRILDKRVSLTTGARYDVQYFPYVDITQASQPKDSKTFQQLSPRAAVVVFPHERLTVMGQLERAFRAPAPAELFGANTFLLASNLKELKPEVVTTYGLAFDLTPIDHVNLRANGYYETFENQIAYSVANANLSTNVYSRTVTGLESELRTDFPLGPGMRLGGFLTYSLAKILDEQVQDKTITASPDKLTWAPSQVANAGVHFRYGPLNVTLQLHYQGSVNRRPVVCTNRADPTTCTGDSVRVDVKHDYPATRPAEVGDWMTLDGRASYQVVEWLRLGVQGTNITNTTGFYIKNNDYPFDYRIEGVRVLGTLEAQLPQKL